MKKQLLLFLVILFFISYGYAQNRPLDFQGMAFDNEGRFMANMSITVKFTIYDSNEPSVNFMEEQELITDDFGVFKALVGKDFNFETLSFSSRDFWLKVEVKKSGDEETFVEVSDARLAAVPFAKTAADGVPIGGIVPFGASTNIAHGWLICNGQAVSRTDYATLFAIIGTTYGVGDGTTTFNLPDLRASTPVGQDITDADFNVVGKTGGAKSHTLTVAQMPSHTHQGQGSTTTDGNHTHSYVDHYGRVIGSNPETGWWFCTSELTAAQRTLTERQTITSYASNHTHSITGNSGSVGGGQSFSLVQSYVTVTFIIRAY